MLRGIPIIFAAAMFALPVHAEEYWYYCDASKSFFPYAQTCSTQWRQVNVNDEMARQQKAAEDKARRDRAAAAARAKAAELAAAKAAGYATVEEYRQAQETDRQRKETEQAAQKAGYPDADSYRNAQAEKSALAQQAAQVTYEDLARYPEQHRDQIVHQIGKVIQVQYKGNDMALRVAITQRGSGGWEDPILCDYALVSSSAPRILEGDVVEFWGQSKGIASNSAIFGQDVSGPEVEIRFVDVKAHIS